MTPLYKQFFWGRRGWLLGYGLLAALRVQAQAPAWDYAAIGSSQQVLGASLTQAVTTDAAGNVFVTGKFAGTVSFGPTLLTSAGGYDVFVAKWVPASGTWAWAQSGGGTGDDMGTSIAVGGSSVYVTGTFSNTLNNANSVLFGGTGPATGSSRVNGASTVAGRDLLLAKYTDAGATATLSWTQVGGGTGDDDGLGVAVSGSNVYVAGGFTNNLANGSTVVFGGGGTTAGTMPVRGASTNSTRDLILTKYTDAGATAALTWVQVAGGRDYDEATGVAVNGANVYVSGTFTNNSFDNNAVLFGGDGTTAGTSSQPGANFSGAKDLLLARYTDLGSSGSYTWSQAAGGMGADYGRGVAVSGTSVYLVGSATNGGVTGTGTGTYDISFATGTGALLGTPSYLTSTELVLAKYTDQGSSPLFRWAQVAGGTGDDTGSGVAVSGNYVYVTGTLVNNAGNANGVVFGGGLSSFNATNGTNPQAGASPTRSPDLLLARYTDQGNSATFDWSQVGGGTGNDAGNGLAVRGNAVYVGGGVGAASAFAFSPLAPTALRGTTDDRAVLATATDGGGSTAWSDLKTAFNGGFSAVRSAATDARGNVFVTGSFYGQLYMGTTLLSSRGYNDLFVAKWVPSTSTWAWALSGGGLDNDAGVGVAVSGSSVYVTGYLTNNLADTNGVLFEGAGSGSSVVLKGVSSSVVNPDLLLAKYQDNGTTGSLVWTEVDGGARGDIGQGVAVSGSSVYVAGSLTNNTTNANSVVFGGNGTTPGTIPVTGTSASMFNDDMLLVKYIDNGATASYGWSQVAGGAGSDEATAVAVSGSSVYVTGSLTNDLGNSQGVVAGGGGTTPGTIPVVGATTTLSSDLLLAKYTDNGTSGSYGWSQVAGGARADMGQSVAVGSGGSVYVTGQLENNAANAWGALFGSNGTVAGTRPQAGASTATSTDLVLARYTDQGSTGQFNWSQVGGGTANDRGQAVSVSGSNVYVVGYVTNDRSNNRAVRFGGSGTTAGTSTVNGASSTSSADMLLTRYTDQGSTGQFNWVQVGGGRANDYGYALAVSGQQVYAAGQVLPAATFGILALNGPANIPAPVGVGHAALARINDVTLQPLPTRAASTGSDLRLWPNPTPGAAKLSGALPGIAVQVLDALGRVRATATTDTTGTATLSGLPSGLYLVRTATATVRLVIE